jgi:hypothetical protein
VRSPDPVTPRPLRTHHPLSNRSGWIAICEAVSRSAGPKPLVEDGNSGPHAVKSPHSPARERTESPIPHVITIYLLTNRRHTLRRHGPPGRAVTPTHALRTRSLVESVGARPRLPHPHAAIQTPPPAVAGGAPGGGYRRRVPRSNPCCAGHPALDQTKQTTDKGRQAPIHDQGGAGRRPRAEGL